MKPLRALFRAPVQIRRFRKDSRGATAIEFAMVSIPFLGLLFATFESAFVFLATEGLEAAVADAGRYIMTGQALTSSYANGNAFRDAVICSPTAPRKRVLPDFIDCSQIIVDVRTATWNTADLSKTFYTGTTKYCIGGSNDVVVIRAVYPMPVYLSVLSATGISTFRVATEGQVSYNGSMRHMLMGTAAFRNEPFSGSYTPPTGC